MAGIRKVRSIEIEALQHFIFSGSDIKLSQEEKLLMHAWWNYTLVSCVANICDEFRFPVYDSIVFWYHLSVRRMQLLFKDHGNLEGAQFMDKTGRKTKRTSFKYDEMIASLASADEKKLSLNATNLREHSGYDQLGMQQINTMDTMDTDDEFQIAVSPRKHTDIQEDTKENDQKEEDLQGDEQ